MTKRKVNYFKKKVDLCEIYQSVAMKFSFASEQNKIITQSHEWVQCRDFLHDAVKAMLIEKSSPIYNFAFEVKKNPPIDLKKMKMLVSQKGLKNGRSFRSNLTSALKLINYYESLIGEDLSTIKQVQGDVETDYKFVWLLTGPKFWISAPHLISLYTFLLRLGHKHITFKTGKELKKKFKQIVAKNNADNDSKYLRDLWDKLDSIILNNNKIVTYQLSGFSSLYFVKMSINTFHNNSGIVSVCKAATWSEEFNKKLKNIFKESYKSDKKINSRKS